MITDHNISRRNGCDLLNTHQAAEYLTISHRTLEAWRMQGIGPDYVKLSPRCLRYRISALNAFIDGRVSHV